MRTYAYYELVVCIPLPYIFTAGFELFRSTLFFAFHPLPPPLPLAPLVACHRREARGKKLIRRKKKRIWFPRSVTIGHSSRPRIAIAIFRQGGGGRGGNENTKTN